MAMLRWAYTDELELSEDDAFLIDLMKLANRFQLQLLRERSAYVMYTMFLFAAYYETLKLYQLYHCYTIFILQCSVCG